jgi:nucleoside-triphosphatase THEP1
MSKNKPTNQKRLILIATNKGGVGKSTAAINIGDYLQSNNIPFVAFDPDHANASFARFFQIKEKNEDGTASKTSNPSFMRLINTADDSSLDQITRAFDEENAEIVLVDGVGAQQAAFLNWIEEISLFERAPSLGLKITFVIIVDEDKDTVDQAREVANKASDQVDYLVIRNLKNSPETTIYDNSPARKLIVNALGGKEITFPKLKPQLVSIIQSESLKLSEAESSEAVYVNDRFRFSSYKKVIFSELDSVKELLTP